MKSRVSLKNLSLQLVAFMAAVYSSVFGAVANVRAADLPNVNDDLSSQNLNFLSELTSSNIVFEEQLIAQAWSELDTQELGLATSDRPANSPSDVAASELSLTQLNQQQQQLIAQVWSELDTQELSLATSDRQFQVSTPQLSIDRLNPQQQQLIAQVWSELNTQELSLATGENTDEIVTSEIDTEQLSIAQPDPQQQIIAQSWTDTSTRNLSLAAPNNNLRLNPAAIEAIEKPKPSRKPVINPPDKREIAARLALGKVRIISPAPGVILDRSHNDSVTVQYPSNTAIKLQVNGAELDNSLITQQQLDKKRNLITQTWQGAELRNGENTLNVIATKDGINAKTSREVVVRDTSTVADANTEASDRDNSEIDKTEPTKTTTDESSSQDTASTQQQQGRVKILSPSNNAILDTIHSSVIIQYPQDASVILQLNGESVDTLQVGRSEVNSITKEITQTWYGIVFRSGVNTLSVLATTDGVNYEETSIRVIVPGKPDALKIETEEAEIPADGSSIATVTGGFVDEYGTIAPWNETITLQSSEGKFVGTDLEPDEPGFQVKPINGEFTAELQAGYDAEMVAIQAKTSKFESYTQIRFKTTLREIPLLTGFADLRFGARGTNFYDSYRDFLPLDEDNGAELDFTAAGFISGSFGKWSYTGAFNSDRGIDEEDDRQDRLFGRYGSSQPEYPVYGDESSSEVTTPSTDNIYLRLERNPQAEFADPDYFMWGDYSTDEFSTEAQEFTAISRQLHGFKSNYNLGDFQLNALYANDVEGFQRDAIAPDGTSGFYFLSRRLLIPGSEDIYVELSPLNDPGNVVFRQRLDSGTDYQIDYDRGTLLFSEPVLNTEVDDNGNILVRRLVATYQFEAEGSDSNLFAGRGRYHFDRDPESPMWLGASLINEDGGDRDFTLWGFDGYFSLGN